MFHSPKDPLNDYLKSTAVRKASVGATMDSMEQALQRFIKWFDKHYGVLHKVWVYGIAFGLSCYWINGAYGWVNLVIIPVQTVLIGALIALVELPTMMLLAVVWGVVSVFGTLLWRWLRRRVNSID
jgi:hypothetical protein